MTINKPIFTDHITIELAREVLETEIKGLNLLTDSLNDDFVRAVKILEKIQGRVVVSGMGKSGHIARKIAATLASTGTPALFIHPGEASHGDLGMITPQDALIALSNSGETSELKPLIHYVKRFAIPLISIVGNSGSSLAEAADVALILPKAREAAIIGAPTTSSTMMLALGDALAVVILERKGFNKEDFGRLHPGGMIGSHLTKIKEIMHHGEKLPIVSLDCLMSEVIIEITKKTFGCAGVIDHNGRLCGIITDGDLRRHIDDNLLSLTAKEVMSINPKTIQANNLVAEALQVMNSKNITSLFVTEDGSLIGLIHIHDCLRLGVQ